MLLAGGSARADALPDPDNSPLLLGIGLPSATEGARLLPAGRVGWRFDIATASHSLQEEDAGEAISFDGETTRAALTFEYALSDRLQLGLSLPYVLHEAGRLDGFIDRWHDWFGLPDGFRPLVANDRLSLRYAIDGELYVNRQARSRGIGDIRLLAAWQLGRDKHRASALRASVKLPSGDSETLTGSGAADFSLGYAVDYDSLAGNARWQGFWRAHAVLVGRPERLGSRANPVIGKLSGGLSYALHPRVTLAMQASLRSAAYDSSIRLLGDTALLLNVGGTIALTDRLQLEVSVGEDLRVHTAPDVTLGMALNYRPGD